MMRKLTGSIPCSLSRLCTVALLLAAALPAAGETLAVEDLLTRHTEALGGAELAKLETLEVTGSFNFNGIDSPFTLYRQRPDRYRIEIETSVGTVISAFDGETAWSLRPDRSGVMQVRAMEGDDRQSFLDQNVDFDGPLVDCAKKGHKVELVGETDVDGVAAYHLKLSLKSGSVQHWFLARDDYRAVRKIATAVHRRAGPYDRTWYLMEHRSTGGVTLPFYVEREDRQHVRAYTVEKVEVGVDLDPAIFEMPEVTPDGS